MIGSLVIKDTIQNSITLLSSYKDKLDNSANVFVFARNEVDATGDVINDFLDIIDYAVKNGYFYVNTIVAPAKECAASELPDNVLYIVWLALNKDHYFNKDAIRESHIWKDVEWGKRARNYNPKGKDPGNVWIPTKDDGKANITEHILLDTSALINRILSCSAQEGLETLLITSDDKKTLETDSRINVKFTAKDHIKSNITPSYILPEVKQPTEITGTVIWGTSENMGKIPDNSISVVVTSPPYWDLKDYFKEGQIGQEPYPVYLNRLNKVWRECFKKLNDTGSLWVNINIRTKNGKVILIPKDFIIQCKRIGFHYKGILIWHKSSGIPTHDKNIVDRHEYVLVFSKSEKLKLNNSITSYHDYKNAAINGGVFWNINRKAGSVGKHFIHPAIYPNELVSRIVKATTDENETVLDPFLGSGTTLVASILEGRNCIGYEYNEGFKELIQSRINNETGSCDSNIKTVI